MSSVDRLRRSAPDAVITTTGAGSMHTGEIQVRALTPAGLASPAGLAVPEGASTAMWIGGGLVLGVGVAWLASHLSKRKRS